MSEEISLKELLQEGLGAYGQGDLKKAIGAWRLVLDLDPNNAEAIDYLKSAGVENTAAKPQATVIELAERRPPVAPPISIQLKELLKDQAYPEALTLLIQAKRNAPQDAAISRAIQHVKDKYVVSLVKELGRLDQRVKLATARDVLDELQLDNPSRRLVEHIDGETSIGDLVRISMLEKHLALAALTVLHKRGLIRLEHAQFTLPPTIVGPAAQDVADNLYSESNTPITEEGLTEHNDLYSKERNSVEKSADFDINFKAATLAYLQGDLHQALELFEKCARLQPDNERVVHNIQRLRSTPT